MTFSTAPSQEFTVIIDEVSYDFILKYNALYDFWNMGISQNGTELANGINLVTNTQLTEQYKNIPFNLQSTYPEDANGSNIDKFVLVVSTKNG